MFPWTAFKPAATETCSSAWQLERGRKSGRRGLPAGCVALPPFPSLRPRISIAFGVKQKAGNKKKSQHPAWANNNTCFPSSTQINDNKQTKTKMKHPTSKGRRPVLFGGRLFRLVWLWCFVFVVVFCCLFVFCKTLKYWVLVKRIDLFPGKCEANGPVVCVADFKISFI